MSSAYTPRGMLSSSRTFVNLAVGFASGCFLARAARAISATDIGCSVESAGCRGCCWDAGACAEVLGAGCWVFWEGSWDCTDVANKTPQAPAIAKVMNSFRIVLSPGKLR